MLVEDRRVAVLVCANLQPKLVRLICLENVRILASGALPNWLTDSTVGRRSDLSSLACEALSELTMSRMLRQDCSIYTPSSRSSSRHRYSLGAPKIYTSVFYN
jgi:hypothetical protein